MPDQTKQLKDILERTNDAYLSVDATWNITYANQQCYNLLGVNTEEIIGLDLRDVLPDVVSMFYKALRRVLTNRESLQTDAYYGPTGKHLELDANPTDEGLLAVFRDITIKKNNEQLIRDAEIRLRTILDTIAEGLITIDDKGLINSFNPAAETMFGYTAKEVIGLNVSILIPEDERQQHEGYTSNSQLYASRIIERTRDLQGLRKDGSVFSLELNVSPLYVKDSCGFVGILRDITERKRNENELLKHRDHLEELVNKRTEELEVSNRKLEELCAHDPLTGISNKRYFDMQYSKEYQRALRNNSNIAILVIDIDYFKLYNDSYGHLQGDKCLITVANLLKNQLARSSDFISRVGGEEFMAVLPGTSVQGALKVAEKMRMSVEKQKIKHSSSPIAEYVTVSVGVSSALVDKLFDANALLIDADNALYEVKRHGRNDCLAHQYLAKA
ncbi:MAG: diguanylate cyclase [Gammaproteobacteria bacterium]|nr:diguanylate cyclase [Gammaproteobacteria bacterium]